jgi:uncharacterized membrane protein
MDTQFLLQLISRWIHVGTAIVLVGGTVCLRCVIQPVLAGQSPELMSAVRNRWKRFVHGGIALFLVSGFYNYVQAMPAHKGDGLYHGLMGTKILLAFGVFYLASALVGRSQGTQRFRDNAAFWKTVIILLTAVIVAISGFLRVDGARKNAVAATVMMPPGGGITP